MQGQQLARLNKLLLEDAFPAELAKSATTGWIVKDGAMASTGTGCGVIYTANDYSRYRLLFTMRHVSGDPDHQACVFIFCTRPQAGEKPLDALGGIQFQVPKGGHWDYRPGMNNSSGEEFTTLPSLHSMCTPGAASRLLRTPPGERHVWLSPASGKQRRYD